MAQKRFSLHQLMQLNGSRRRAEGRRRGRALDAALARDRRAPRACDHDRSDDQEVYDAGSRYWYTKYAAAKVARASMALIDRIRAAEFDPRAPDALTRLRAGREAAFLREHFPADTVNAFLVAAAVPASDKIATFLVLLEAADEAFLVAFYGDTDVRHSDLFLPPFARHRPRLRDLAAIARQAPKVDCSPQPVDGKNGLADRSGAAPDCPFSAERCLRLIAMLEDAVDRRAQLLDPLQPDPAGGRVERFFSQPDASGRVLAHHENLLAAQHAAKERGHFLYEDLELVLYGPKEFGEE